MTSAEQLTTVTLSVNSCTTAVPGTYPGPTPAPLYLSVNVYKAFPH
jgi:hypothetical protein